MNKRLKIAIGKIGKSILFDSSKWGARGGDNEAPIFFENLFHRNPDIDFYLIGLSDYCRLKQYERDRINKNGNVIDIWENRASWVKQHPDVDKENENIPYMEWWMENSPEIVSSIDIGLFMFGPTGTSNVKGKTRLMTNPDQLAESLLMLAKYAGPVIHFLNESKLPYIGVLNDPRFFPAIAKDFFNAPRVVLSQYNEIVEHKSKINYIDTELVRTPVSCKYAAMETTFLIGKDPNKPIENKQPSLDSFFSDVNAIESSNTTVKDIQFMIVCNEGRPSRYNLLKTYILDHIENVDIYGQWNSKVIGDDSRFKGPRKFSDLQELLPRVKYTFCIPIKKGWATAKFWEMIHYGIIPFMHPTYDEQGNIGFPEFLYVKDSAQLQKKIEYLENHPEDYNKLVKELKKMIRPEYYSGEYLNNITITEVKDLVSALHWRQNE